MVLGEGSGHFGFKVEEEKGGNTVSPLSTPDSLSSHL